MGGHYLQYLRGLWWMRTRAQQQRRSVVGKVFWLSSSCLIEGRAFTYRLLSRTRGASPGKPRTPANDMRMYACTHRRSSNYTLDAQIKPRTKSLRADGRCYGGGTKRREQALDVDIVCLRRKSKIVRNQHENINMKRTIPNQK